MYLLQLVTVTGSGHLHVSFTVGYCNRIRTSCINSGDSCNTESRLAESLGTQPLSVTLLCEQTVPLTQD